MECLLIVFGLIWDLVFPINKSLWSSSFVFFTSGLATVCLSLLYYIIDIANRKNWIKLFLIWGVKPHQLFFSFSGIIPCSTHHDKSKSS